MEMWIGLLWSIGGFSKYANEPSYFVRVSEYLSAQRLLVSKAGSVNGVTYALYQNELSS
jgi:hypothetical protein